MVPGPSLRGAASCPWSCGDLSEVLVLPPELWGATASSWEPAREGDKEAQECLGPFPLQELMQAPCQPFLSLL